MQCILILTDSRSNLLGGFHRVLKTPHAPARALQIQAAPLVALQSDAAQGDSHVDRMSQEDRMGTSANRKRRYDAHIATLTTMGDDVAAMEGDGASDKPAAAAPYPAAPPAPAKAEHDEVPEYRSFHGVDALTQLDGNDDDEAPLDDAPACVLRGLCLGDRSSEDVY